METKIGEIQSILAQAIGRSRYEMWLKPSKIEVSNVWINVFAKNSFVYERLNSLHGQLQFALRQVLPHFSLRIFPPSEKGDLSLYVILDRFIAGRENKFLSSLLKETVTTSSWDYGILFLHGEEGMGKSHFLKTLANGRQKNFPREKILFITGDVLQERLASHRTNGFDLADYDAWLVDDFTLREDPQVQKTLLGALNQAKALSRLVVFTSSLPVTHYSQASEALYSRLAHGLVHKINPPEYETKIALACAQNSKAAHLRREVLEYLARSLATPRDLLSAIDQLIKGNLPESITLSQARQVADELGGKGAMESEEIIDEVAHYFHLTSKEVTSRRQKRVITKARRVCAYIFREYLELSFGEIASCLGGLSTSTIRLYVKKVEKDKENQGPLFVAVEKVWSQLREGR